MEVPVINIEHIISNSEELPKDISDGKSDDEKQEEDEIDNSEEEVEEEQVEEEDVEREMTPEEKKAMYEAVKSGDIDALEACLDKPHSDINMVWYKENLLMAAIRHGQEEMAEFLLDNGVDHTYSTGVMELRETRRGIRVDRYDLTCRQMAYDQGLLDIVQIIDLLEGNVFSFVRAPRRTPRHRRPPPAAFAVEDFSDHSDDHFDDIASLSDNESGIHPRMRSKETKQRKTDVYSETLRPFEGQIDADETSMQTQKGHAHTREDDSKKNIKRTQQNGNRNGTHENEVHESDMNRDKVDKVNVDFLYPSSRSSIVKSNPQFSEGRLYPHVEKVSKKNPEEFIPNKQAVTNDIGVTKATFGKTAIKDEVLDDLPQPKQSVIAPPSNRIYSSKSVLALRKVNSHRRLLNDKQANIQSRPLKWRKVSTRGSYVTESRHWHTKTTRKQASSVEVNEITSSTVPTPKHFVDEICRSSSQLNRLSKPGAASVVSCVNDISKQSSSVVSCVNDISKQSSSVVPCVNDISKQSSSNKKYSARTRANSSSVAFDHDRPVKTTRRRISPRFMNSYEVLDFVPDTRKQTSSSNAFRRLGPDLSHNHFSPCR